MPSTWHILTFSAVACGSLSMAVPMFDDSAAGDTPRLQRRAFWSDKDMSAGKTHPLSIYEAGKEKPANYLYEYAPQLYAKGLSPQDYMTSERDFQHLQQLHAKLPNWCHGRNKAKREITEMEKRKRYAAMDRAQMQQDLAQATTEALENYEKNIRP